LTQAAGHSSLLPGHAVPASGLHTAYSAAGTAAAFLLLLLLLLLSVAEVVCAAAAGRCSWKRS
jgi:hypothetical protein